MWHTFASACFFRALRGFAWGFFPWIEPACAMYATLSFHFVLANRGLLVNRCCILNARVATSLSRCLLIHSSVTVFSVARAISAVRASRRSPCMARNAALRLNFSFLTLAVPVSPGTRPSLTYCDPIRSPHSKSEQVAHHAVSLLPLLAEARVRLWLGSDADSAA